MKLELNKTNRQNVEDIYPLSPMQEGMLFESLYAPDSGVYFELLIYTLTGKHRCRSLQGSLAAGGSKVFHLPHGFHLGVVEPVDSSRVSTGGCDAPHPRLA